MNQIKLGGKHGHDVSIWWSSHARTCAIQVCLASKTSGGRPGDEAAQGDARDEGEDEASGAGGHGVHGGRGQLGETVGLRKERSHVKKGIQITSFPTRAI